MLVEFQSYLCGSSLILYFLAIAGFQESHSPDAPTTAYQSAPGEMWFTCKLPTHSSSLISPSCPGWGGASCKHVRAWADAKAPAGHYGMMTAVRVAWKKSATVTVGGGAKPCENRGRLSDRTSTPAVFLLGYPYRALVVGNAGPSKTA